MITSDHFISFFFHPPLAVGKPSVFSTGQKMNEIGESTYYRGLLGMSQLRELGSPHLSQNLLMPLPDQNS
jgi:hypothetical protein